MPRILSFSTAAEMIDEDQYTKVTVNIESSRYSSFSFVTGDWEGYYRRFPELEFTSVEGIKVKMVFSETLRNEPVPHIDITFTVPLEPVMGISMFQELTFHHLRCSLRKFSEFADQFIDEEIIEVTSSEEEEAEEGPSTPEAKMEE